MKIRLNALRKMINEISVASPDLSVTILELRQAIQAGDLTALGDLEERLLAYDPSMVDGMWLQYAGDAIKGQEAGKDTGSMNTENYLEMAVEDLTMIFHDEGLV